MNRVAVDERISSTLAETAKRRLLADKGEPLAVLEWHRVLFLHFEVDPDIVIGQLPTPFELELHEQKAIVSLVALTKRDIRPTHAAPLWVRLLPRISEQRFFNVRTYVRYHDEPGTFFFWSWLSRPWGLPLPTRPFGLTCGFAGLSYDHGHEIGELRGVVANEANRKRFAYKSHFGPDALFTACAPGSLAEFALERYTGYFWHRGGGRVFRAWHPSWSQTVVQIEIEDDGLVTGAFPWLNEARLVGANYAPGFNEVWIGRPHPLGKPVRGDLRRHGPSALFRMP